MKFTITREKLHEGLQAVAASVPSKTTLPVLANILVEASKDGLKLSGTDLDISVSTTIPASVDGVLTTAHASRKLQPTYSSERPMVCMIRDSAVKKATGKQQTIAITKAKFPVSRENHAELK